MLRALGARMNTYFVTLSSLILALAACGSGATTSGSTTTDDSGTTPAAGACEAAGTRICQRACACSTDGKCRVAVKTDGGATASISWDNEEKCRNLYVTFGCIGGGTAGLDYGSCDSAVAASSCVADGILLPDACKSPQ